MMPEMFPWLSPQNVERARAISLELLRRDYDILCFEKAFDRAAREVIVDALGRRYPYRYGPLNDGGLLLNGGVWVLSRIKLGGYRAIEFRESIGFESACRKGAMLLFGKIESQWFQLIATHLQGDDRSGYVSSRQQIRDAQMRQIVDELIRPHGRPDLPLFLCGDMSTPRLTTGLLRRETKPYREMLALFEAENGPEFRATLDDSKRHNDLATDDTGLVQELDYILVRRSSSQISGRWVRELIRHPGWDQRREHNDLSYRYAVSGEFQFG
jgi:hypothetical protein